MTLLCYGMSGITFWFRYRLQPSVLGDVRYERTVCPVLM